MPTPLVSLTCSGCGREASLRDPWPFRCAAATPGDDIDHVLVRRISPAVAFPEAPQGNPYGSFAELMSPLHRARALGLPDDAVRQIVEDLDAALVAVDGVGFSPTPWVQQPALAEQLGVPRISLWAKDETANVSGSHKARHLMGVMVHLLVAERAGVASALTRPPLAIASCGNAALAAGVVAAAARWPLQVFVPTDADPPVLARLERLGATVTVCPRDDVPGDPCYRAFVAAVQAGALPFSVQGSDNGLAVEGGLTLGYELADQIRRGPGGLDLLVVQVGGGALGSACVHALRDAVEREVIPAMPRLCTVQTESAWPLRRAYLRVAQRLLGADPTDDDPRAVAERLRTVPRPAVDAALHHAATHRGTYMWPWDGVPHSVAHGILDDETYDWHALVDGMISTGGWPLVVDEPTLVQAHRAVSHSTAVPASPTATAGVAGVLAMARAGCLQDGQTVGVLLTGRTRG